MNYFIKKETAVELICSSFLFWSEGLIFIRICDMIEQMFDYNKRPCKTVWRNGVFMKITEQMTIGEKLRILTDAAKYDVACTSSGNKRSGDGSGM